MSADLGIGERAKELRKLRGLSLQAVCDRAGMTKSWLWDIEQGRQKNPTINSAVALSRALGVSLDYLIGISTTMPDLHPEALRIATEVDALLRSPK
jgi:transcriptional regulator with XRE-family HTH domain